MEQVGGIHCQIIILPIATCNCCNDHDISGCPRIVRSDYGTENASLSGIQIAFRYHHCDSLRDTKSFIYGPSRSNIVHHDIV